MIYFLFILYTLLFCGLILRLKFFVNSGLSSKVLLTLFLIKILTMIIGCYANVYILPISDSLTFHQMGIDEFNLLFQNPHEYLINIFHTNSPEAYTRLLDDSNSFWNNLRTNLLAKMLSIFNFFSLQSFLINTLFFNFLIFFGCIAFYKTFIKIFPNSFYQLVICIFLLPSASFYSAMIHRDGLILLALSMILYHVFCILHEHHFSWKRISILTFFLLLIFLLRNFVFIALIPALLAWILSKKFPKHTFLCFLGVYVITTILFFSSGFISSRTDLPKYVSSRQQSFIRIGNSGNSTIEINKLYPTFKSFLFNAPQALNHSLMRPYLSEIVSIYYIPFAVEILLMEILLIIFLLYKKQKIIIHPAIYFGIFLSLTILLMTGYTIPILGAIVRYRSIYFIFLLIPITCYTDWKKIQKTFKFRWIKN